jgi:hypothetical protein
MIASPMSTHPARDESRAGCAPVLVTEVAGECAGMWRLPQSSRSCHRDGALEQRFG